MDRQFSKLFVGMEVHKESIDIAVAEEGGEVRHHGRICGDLSALLRTVRKLESLNRVLVFPLHSRAMRYRRSGSLPNCGGLLKRSTSCHRLPQ